MNPKIKLLAQVLLAQLFQTVKLTNAILFGSQIIRPPPTKISTFRQFQPSYFHQQGMGKASTIAIQPEGRSGF